MKDKAYKLTVLSVMFFAAFAVSLFAVQPEAASFAPLPSAEQLIAQSPEERDAGVVALSQSLDISGFAHVGAFRTKGSVTQEISSRFIVLDSKGVQAVSRHIFLGGVGSTIKGVAGRTVTPDGKIYPLDAERDVKNLDIRTAGGKTARAMRAAFFPHVVAGSILDLSYTVIDTNLPDFEVVPLQGAFPIRHLRLHVRGRLLKNVAWVPFFLGPSPPGARASLDNHFNLTLNLDDVPPTRDEPLAPPATRAGFRLGLMPEVVKSFKHPFEDGDAVKYAPLFGQPVRVLHLATLESSPGKSLAGAIEPSVGTVVLDDLGLQAPPDWTASQDAKPLMAWWNDVLGRIDKRLDRFFRRTGKAENKDDLEKIVPSSLPVEERVERLYGFARKRIHPDPHADGQRNLNVLFACGQGDERDVDLYLVYLLRKAGIPAKMVLAFNRYSPAYQPVLESFRPFFTSFFVKVSPAGSAPTYLMPGDPFATYHTFPQTYLGALAFVQPDEPKAPWSISRISSKLPLHGLTKVSFEATLPDSATKVRLAMKTTLTDDAAHGFRWELGWDRPKPIGVMERGHLRIVKQGEKSITGRWKKVYNAWIDSWANIKPTGKLPDVNTRLNVDKPLTFSMQGDWDPGIRRVGSRLLVPAFPDADIFANPFQAERRYDPIWWRDPGDYEISLTWVLPPGASVDELPPASRAAGPGGLSFAATFTSKTDTNKGHSKEVTCTVKIHHPAMLPASAYPEVKTFCEVLQRLSNTRFLVDISDAGAKK